MTARMLDDDVVLTRLSEEADFRWNQSHEDRLVVVGMKSSDYPTGLAQRKEYLSARLLPFIEGIIGEKVVDFYPKQSYLKNDRVPPFVIRFPSVQDCQRFKREAHKVQKDHESLKGLLFQPCVTPATRIRIEVLRAISRKVLAPELSAYCPIFGLRPILHVGPLVSGKVQPKETLTYVPAVLRFRHLLTIRDLYFAYKNLGDSFFGSLRQTFIVLNEEDRKNSATQRVKETEESRGRGQKRAQEQETTSNAKKKP